MNKRKQLFISTIIFALVLFLFTACSAFGRHHDPLSAVKENAAATEVIKTIPLNEKNDSLCLYRLSDGSAGVAYLDCRGNKYKSPLFFNDVKEHINYKFRAADSNLEIAFSIYSDPSLVTNGDPEDYKFNIGERVYYLGYRLSPQKVTFNKSSFYDMSYLYEIVDDIVTSFQDTASSHLEEFATAVSNIAS